MKFYRTSDFSTVALKCQDSFKGICSRSSSSPSSVSMCIKQCMEMEAVKREHIQMLGFVSLFLKAWEKCAASIEDVVHSSQLGDEMAKDLEEILSFIQIQYSCLGSVDKALEMVTDASMTMACHLQLARRDTTLKPFAPQLHEYDRNRLRRSGFMSVDLFSPAILNAVEKKLEKESSPKRQKLDVKPQHTTSSHSYGSSYNKNAGESSFCDFKRQQKSSQSSRGGRRGRRK